MVTSVRHQDPHQIWTDISKGQWELLWSGETDLHKYGSVLWTTGHKTVNLFPDETAISTPHIMCITGPDVQKHTSKISSTKGLPQTTRQTIEQYLKIADWSNLLVNKDSHENDQSWVSSTVILTYSCGRVSRHKAHIDPRHSTVMVDRDTHGRIMDGGTIPKRGPLNTIGTGVTNSMVSPHRSHKTRSKDNWKYHPIREPHRKQSLRMINLPDMVHDNIQYMLSPKMCPSTNLHEKRTLCREHHRNRVEPQKNRDGSRGHRPTDGPKHSVPSGS
jgi:hypothetical protein